MTAADIQFDVVTDGGCDFFPTLIGADFAPFSLTFGDRTYQATDLSREAFYRELASNPKHPTTSQPTPQQFADLFETHSGRPLLCVTISSGLSGSLSAADQARQLAGGTVELHDSRTLSAAQAFQVHAAGVARERGHDLETARGWMRQVSEETELYFTIDTLSYLRKGGRIGRVAAMLGGLLNLKPVVTVDKQSGAYTSAGRARSWRGAIEAVAAQVTARYGAGTPLRLGLLYGDARQDAEALLAQLEKRHPIVWQDFTGVGTALSVHTGPKAAGLAVAPGAWPWER